MEVAEVDMAVTEAVMSTATLAAAATVEVEEVHLVVAQEEIACQISALVFRSRTGVSATTIHIYYDANSSSKIFLPCQSSRSPFIKRILTLQLDPRPMLTSSEPNTPSQFKAEMCLSQSKLLMKLASLRTL